MKYTQKLLFIFFLCTPFVLFSSQEKDVEYEFIRNDSSYSFRGSFSVTAGFDCLLDVVYKFEHISKYTSGAKSIELGKQGQNWYEVTYTYRKLIFFENKSTWRRTFYRKEGKVVFEMISSKNNIGFMPEVISSTGYYQINAGNDGLRVEYFQECKLKSGLLKNTYINKAKKEAIKFLDLFRTYVEKNCDSIKLSRQE